MRQKRPIAAKILCGLLVCALVAGYSLPEVSAADEEQASEKEAVLQEEDKEESTEAAVESMDESKEQMDEESMVTMESEEIQEEKTNEKGLSGESQQKETKISTEALLDLPAEPADSGTCDINLEWEVSGDHTQLTIRGEGELRAYPSSSSLLPWKAYINEIKTVVLEEGIVSINNAAFANYQQLTEVILPESMTSIGMNAFSRCTKLETVTFPVGLKNIGRAAFANCTSLKTIHYSGNQEQWEELLSTMPVGNDALSSSGVTMTYGAYKLTISRDTPGYFSRRTAEADGKSISGSKTEDVFMYVPAGETVTFDGELAETMSPFWRIAGIMDYDSRLYFIDYLEWKDGKRTFEMPAQDTEVTLTLMVLVCGEFDNEEAPLSWDIDRIDGGDSLKLTITGIGAMETGGARQSEYWDWHRWKSQIAELSLPEGLTYIGSNAFSLCTSLRKVEIPTSVRGLGYHAFYSSGLTEVTVPGIALCPVGSGGEYGQTGLNYGQGVFSQSKLLEKAEILDSGVPLNLGGNIFAGCTNLKEVILPNSIVSTVNGGIFYGVPPLETVYFRGTEEEWAELLGRIPTEGNEALLNAKKVVYRYGWPEVTGSETNTDGSVTVTVSSIGSGDSFTEGELSEVTVDGKTVDPANYTLTGGKLTFLSSYMDTLKEGAHEIVLKYADGKEAAATITVTKTGSSVNPQPGQGTGSGTGTGTGSGSAGGTGGNGTGNGTSAGSNNAGNGSSAAVQTGDPAQTGVWGALLLASLASIGCVACSQRRRRRSII